MMAEVFSISAIVFHRFDLLRIRNVPGIKVSRIVREAAGCQLLECSLGADKLVRNQRGTPVHCV